MNTGKQSEREDDDEIYPLKATGFPPNEAAKPENWFEVHNNVENQAKRKRKYPDLKVGDKVKVFKERRALAKEVVGDYKHDATDITGIERSLGQTFFWARGEGKPFLRSDTPLVDGAEDGEPAAAAVSAKAPGESDEPYVSHKRERIIAREKNKKNRAERESQTGSRAKRSSE